MPATEHVLEIRVIEFGDEVGVPVKAVLTDTTTGIDHVLHRRQPVADLAIGELPDGWEIVSVVSDEGFPVQIRLVQRAEGHMADLSSVDLVDFAEILERNQASLEAWAAKQPEAGMMGSVLAGLLSTMAGIPAATVNRAMSRGVLSMSHAMLKQKIAKDERGGPDEDGHEDGGPDNDWAGLAKRVGLDPDHPAPRPDIARSLTEDSEVWWEDVSARLGRAAIADRATITDLNDHVARLQAELTERDEAITELEARHDRRDEAMANLAAEIERFDAVGAEIQRVTTEYLQRHFPG